MTRPAKARDTSDFGTPERGQHGDHIVLTDTDARAGSPKRAYVTTESPLARMARVGQLGKPDEAKRRVEAGNWLLAVFWKAGLSNRLTCDMQPRIQGGRGGDYHRVLNYAAYQDYMAALDAIRDSARWTVYGVCCLYESGRGRMHLLRPGLDDLAWHRGIR